MKTNNSFNFELKRFLFLFLFGALLLNQIYNLLVSSIGSTNTYSNYCVICAKDWECSGEQIDVVIPLLEFKFLAEETDNMRKQTE